MHRRMKLAALVLAFAFVGCGEGGPGNGPEEGTLANCSPSDPVCPTLSSQLGYSGAAGAPSITPSSSTTTISTASSSEVVTGTTSATSNGHWLIVTDNTLRASGVLAVESGTFSGEIPLFCGTQQVIYTFEAGGNRAYYRTSVTQTGCVAAQLRVQLSWDTDESDIDLHLIRPNGSVETDDDCYYGNCQGGGLDWGAVGDAGDPLLDVDDVFGFGPENIIISAGAETGEYRVVVHNFDGAAATRATVKIFINEVERQRFTSQTLDAGSRDYWQVARVNVNTGVVTAVNTYSAAPPFRVLGGTKKTK